MSADLGKSPPPQKLFTQHKKKEIDYKKNDLSLQKNIKNKFFVK